MFSIIERKQNYSIYTPTDTNQFPFELVMMHNPKKKTIYQYPNNMNLHWAIDQFQTVFNYNASRNLPSSIKTKHSEIPNYIQNNLEQIQINKTISASFNNKSYGKLVSRNSTTSLSKKIYKMNFLN